MTTSLCSGRDFIFSDKVPFAHVGIPTRVIVSVFLPVVFANVR